MSFPRLCVVLLGLAWVTVTACGSSSRVPPAEHASVGSEDALLSPGDIFEVRVYGEKELSGEYRVGPDGNIEYPFIGSVAVGGMPPGAVSQRIATLLREGDYLKTPQVMVFVKEYASKRISVTGAVGKDGTFPMESGLTVVQAISLAGGFTPLASQNSVVVTRRVGGQLKRYRVRAEDISEGRAEDFVLQAGDIIYVPERLF
ncbi:MAG: polysaccharide export protein [Myxococcales bacterium]|nr:polysaccharide export protein [Myxococcales bacterium]MCB9708699.1 polysaccharide export protein [Myxococcales bacterium]